MSSETSKGRILAVVGIWLTLFLVGAMVVRWYLKPKKAHDEQVAQQKEVEKVIGGTTARSRYDSEINFAIDAFPGFAILRSDNFKEEMTKHKIRVNFMDDGADYPARIKAFKDGTVQMGVFTADALIKSCAESSGTPPATIIAFVDETRGADAMVGYKDIFPNVDSLNTPDIKFINPGGPSDTLCRVLMSQFRLNNLGNPFKQVPDAKDVFEAYRKSKPTDKQVYVLWEPWVSKILDNPNTHVIVDSSRFHGYIMDVIVANRDYLFKNPEIVRIFLESYFRAFYHYKDDLPKLLIADGKLTGNPLNDREAQRIVDGVWFKNTSDNFAQMGLSDKDTLLHVEDMLNNITRVLVSTGSIASDPTHGHMNLLYYDGSLKSMSDAGFHPGIQAEEIRTEKVSMPVLTDSQWNQLLPIGQLEVPPLIFGRGGSTLTDASTEILTELADKLKSWPTYYLSIKGNASLQGDRQANAQLALARAKAAKEFLVSHDISPNRIHATGEANGETSVSFVLGQPPY